MQLLYSGKLLQGF